MKRTLYLLPLLVLSMLLVTSCKKDDPEPEPPTPAEMLVGKWVIQSAEILGQVTPGNGSYLTFNACSDTECTGVDYDASDLSSGTFTYELSEDALTVVITDTTADGGGYDGTWNILQLTETDFSVEGNTFLGTLKMDMTKEQ